MAKRSEFKPDKPRVGFLSRLYLTKKQRRSVLKWVLYSLVLLFLSLVQDVLLCNMNILGATTELVPVGIFLICLLEGSEGSALFLLLSSAFYVFSGTAAGNYCIVFITVFGLLATILRQSYLQKGFFAALVCCFGAMLLYEIAVFFIGLFFSQTLFARFYVFPLTAVLSMIAVPVLYPICCGIAKVGGGDPWKE